MKETCLICGKEDLDLIPFMVEDRVIQVCPDCILGFVGFANASGMINNGTVPETEFDASKLKIKAPKEIKQTFISRPVARLSVKYK